MGNDAEPLLGGNMGEVERQGDCVLRPSGAWTPAVHRLLHHLAAAGVRGVPSPRGTTDDGREDLAYLAYRIVPLSSGDRRDGFDDEERRRRLEHLLSAYGCDAPPHEVVAVLHERLLALADFSDAMAESLGRPALSEHARLYRHDADHLHQT